MSLVTRTDMGPWKKLSKVVEICFLFEKGLKGAGETSSITIEYQSKLSRNPISKNKNKTNIYI